MNGQKDSIVTFLQVENSNAASGVLTSANTGNFTNGKIVTIGNRVYIFKTDLSSGPTVANEVLIGVDADTTLANLVKAINASGTPGTEYSIGTLVNADVTAGAVTAHATTITAIIAGFAGNALVSTTDEAKLSWGASTLVGGIGGVLSSAAIGGVTGTYYTVPLDMSLYTEIQTFLNVISHSGTNPTLDLTLQVSPDKLQWTDHASLSQITTTDSQTKRTFSKLGKYSRFKIVLGGTTPRYVLTASLVQNQVTSANDVEGNLDDAAIITDTTGSVSGKLRGLVKIFADVWDSTAHLLKVGFGNLISGEDLAANVLGVQIKPTISGTYAGTPGFAAYNDVDILVRNSAAQLLSISCNNKNAAERFLWIKNKATVIANPDTATQGSDLVIPLPASSNGLIDLTNFLKTHGAYFGTGLTIGVSTSASTFTPATTTDHFVVYSYL